MNDVFLNAAELARSLAAECRLEADRQPWRREYWLSEAARKEGDAGWYERRAFTNHTDNQRDAA